MPAQHHAKRPSWNAARAAVRSVSVLASEHPRSPLRFRPVATWFGRCPAFRPSHPEDGPRGRMAHAED